MAYAIQCVIDITGVFEPDHAFSKFTTADDFGFEVALKANAFSNLHFAAGPHQCFPCFPVFRDGTKQKNLDTSRQILPPLRVVLADRKRACPHATTKEAGRKYLGVVQNQAILWREEFRKVPEHPVFPTSGAAMENEHSGCGTVVERALRDQLFRQVIIEFRDIHATRLSHHR